MPQNNEDNENKGGRSDKAVVVKAFIHCDGCSDKVSRCLRGLEGVENIVIDRENNKVTVKGEVVKDPLKVLERLKKKYSKNVELLSPKIKPEKPKKEEKKEKDKPIIKTVMLKMYIYCDGCENDVKRKIEKMEGVVSVALDKEKSQVTVKGTMEKDQLEAYVKKQLKKHAYIINVDDNKKENKNNEICQKPEIIFSYPPQYSAQHTYPNQTFSDENPFACSIM
ncbi:heavy metal-associated isoprenylated plant protein 8-like [Arachis duranensis]|uniref:Heavy metal-associated isoprenylated plant protein 8-like n=1 Tax=Arachis duranensis TaxID=130453 RepID=A0A9C6WM94_ARADU|nr:heavy metal-associated isoprenylated plant protein 8-like [Arachis duranensis]